MEYNYYIYKNREPISDQWREGRASLIACVQAIGCANGGNYEDAVYYFDRQVLPTIKSHGGLAKCDIEFAIWIGYSVGHGIAIVDDGTSRYSFTFINNNWTYKGLE